MAPVFFDPKEKVTSSVLRATLLSSSLDSWRRNHYKAPLYRPPEAGLVTPLSVRRITPQFALAHQETGYDYVHHFVSREMDDCKHTYGGTFRAKTERQLKFKSRAPAGTAAQGLAPSTLGPDDSKFASKIEFDTDTDVTTVSVGSVINGVTEEDGVALIRRAIPSNWAASPGGFFKEVVPGTLVGNTFKPDSTVEQSREPYQIQEHVEWNWGPQLEATGSMVNVLEIDMLTDKSDYFEAAEKFAKGLIELCASDRKVSDYNFNGLSHKIDYTYRLVRCLESKFLSSWVPGGLDVDAGRYVALWCPSKQDPKRGVFLTTIEKRIHFSQAAEREAFPQFAQLLNLLAPAVVTMLLKELAYNSTLKFIHDRH